MRFRINGCLINLRSLSDEQLTALIDMTVARAERVDEELETLSGESIRRRESGQPQLQLVWSAS